MGLFGKPKAVVVVGRNWIEFRYDGRAEPLRWQTDGVQDNHEVTDKEKYSKFVLNGIIRDKLKEMQVIVVLSEEVLFWKMFLTSNGKVNPKEISDFTEKIPLDPQKIIKKLLVGKNQVAVVAVNRDLFECLIAALEMKKWKILTVVPQSITGMIDSKNWKLLFSKIGKLRAKDFRITRDF